MSDGDIGTVGKRENDSILENDDNTISGSGAMLEMGLKNDLGGTVDANAAGGTLTIGGGIFGSGGDIVQNAGRMEASNGGTLVFDVDVTNTGGTIEAFASSGVILNDTTTGGRVVADGGSVSINGIVTDATVIETNGTIEILGTVQGGTLETSASVVMIAVGATLDGFHGAVTNRGSLSVDESVAFRNRHVYYGSNSLTLDGTIVNSGSIDLYGPHALVSLLVGTPTVTVMGGGKIVLGYGGIEATKANETLVNVNDTISGTGFLGQGKLVLDNKGLVEAAAGDTLTFDVGTATASVNTGTLDATQGGQLDFLDGSFTNTGRLIVGAFGSTAVFAKTTQVTNNAKGTLEGGQWDIGGVLSLAGTAITIDAATIELVGSSSVFEVGAANTKIEQSLTTIAQIGVLTLDKRNYTTSNALTLYGRLSLIGSTVKSGRITAGAASVISGFGTIESSVSDVGTITASGGDLRFTTIVNGAAKASIGAHATLEFDAAAAATVTFATGGGKLLLDAASHFTGSIVALGKGDTIDADHFGKGTSLTYSVNAKKTGGVLTLVDGSARASLTLAGSHVSGGFHLTTGTNGDTLITYAAPTAKTAAALPEAKVSSSEQDHLAAFTQSLFEGAFGVASSAGSLDFSTHVASQGVTLAGVDGHSSGAGFLHPADG